MSSVRRRHQQHHSRSKSREMSRELYNASGKLPTSIVYDPTIEMHRYALAYALRDGLFGHGFVKHSFHKEFHSRECVYLKPVKPHLYVTVYTTIEFHECRAKDTDAIRVVGIYESTKGSMCPLVKTIRVFRRGKLRDIVARTLERVDEVEAALGSGDDLKICPRSDCDAPMFLSKKGRWVCGELCFKRKRPPKE